MPAALVALVGSAVLIVDGRLLEQRRVRASVQMGAVFRRMMKHIVDFPLDQGGRVLIQVDEPSVGPVIRGGLGKDGSTLVGEAGQTFECDRGGHAGGT